MPPNPLKLVSVNIEGHKHLELVLPFLREQNPDVVCLQEVFELDFNDIAHALGMQGHFAPMTLLQLDRKTGPHTPWGIGLLSRLPITNVSEHYYSGSRDTLQICVDNIKTTHKVLLSGTVQNDGARYTIGTTHFTWSRGGQADEYQRHDMPELLAALAKFPEIVFCGDFNAPRGREMFTILASRYKDNIPEQYTTSIDGALHRDGKLDLMVDGLFSTPRYRTANVKLVNGVSDHCAIVAEIFRA